MSDTELVTRVHPDLPGRQIEVRPRYAAVLAKSGWVEPPAADAPDPDAPAAAPDGPTPADDPGTEGAPPDPAPAPVDAVPLTMDRSAEVTAPTAPTATGRARRVPATSTSDPSKEG